MDKEPGVRRGRRVEWLTDVFPVPWGAANFIKGMECVLYYTSAMLTILLPAPILCFSQDVFQVFLLQG